MSPRPIVARVRTHAWTPEAADTLRDAYSRWASGVTLITLLDDGELLAMVASAFTPVSLEPPLVLVCVHNDAALLPSLLDVGRFTVNLLTEELRGTASRTVSGTPLPASLLAEGPDPVLRGALASLVCTVGEVHAAGDHHIVTARVEEARTGGTSAPLLYYGREYRGMRT